MPSDEQAVGQQEQGLLLLDAGCRQEAIEHLRRAYLAESRGTRFDSWLELSTLDPNACSDAERWLTLADVYLEFGRRLFAVRCLRRALAIDPDNEQVHRQLARLGLRRRPALRLLPREHLANRLIGRVRAWLARAH